MQAVLKFVIYALSIGIYVTLYAVIEMSNKSAFPMWNDDIGYAFAAFVLIILGVLLLLAKHFHSKGKIDSSFHVTPYRTHIGVGALMLLVIAALPTLKNFYLKQKYEITTIHRWSSGTVDFVEINVRNKFLCEIIDRSATSFEDRNKDGFDDLLIDDHVMLYEPLQKTFLNCPYLGG